MRPLRQLSPAEALRVIFGPEADGWFHASTKGDHWQFKHATKPGRVTVTHPRRDFPVGTLKSVESGVKLR